MTQAFDKFVKQYEMTGSEKADGYSKDAFIGLDEHEKERVFDLLKTELPWSAEWLFFVNPEKALIIAKKEEEKLRGDPYQHVYIIQQQIVAHSGDLLYQQRMIEDYCNYSDSLKPLVVDAISKTPTNEALINFLKEVILTEVNTSAVARASRHFLNTAKIPRTTEVEEQRFKQLISELRSDNTQSKRRAVSAIDKYRERSACPE